MTKVVVAGAALVAVVVVLSVDTKVPVVGTKVSAVDTTVLAVAELAVVVAAVGIFLQNVPKSTLPLKFYSWLRCNVVERLYTFPLVLQ